MATRVAGAFRTDAMPGAAMAPPTRLSGLPTLEGLSDEKRVYQDSYRDVELRRPPARL
jgi:hypothetical protein